MQADRGLDPDMELGDDNDEQELFLGTDLCCPLSFIVHQPCLTACCAPCVLQMRSPSPERNGPRRKPRVRAMWSFKSRTLISWRLCRTYSAAWRCRRMSAFSDGVRFRLTLLGFF